MQYYCSVSKEKLESLASKYLAEVKEVLGDTRGLLAEGAVVFDELGVVTKTVLVEGALSRSVQVLTLLKACQRKSVDVAPSMRALMDAVDGASVFVGGYT